MIKQTIKDIIAMYKQDIKERNRHALIPTYIWPVFFSIIVMFNSLNSGITHFVFSLVFAVILIYYSGYIIYRDLYLFRHNKKINQQKNLK